MSNLKKNSVKINYKTSFYASIREVRNSDSLWENAKIKKIENFIIKGAYAYMLDHMEKCYFIKDLSFGIPYEYKIAGNRAHIHIKKVTVEVKKIYKGVVADDPAVQSKINEMVSYISASRKSSSRYDTLYAIASYMTSNFSYGNGDGSKNPPYYTIAGVALDKYRHTGVCEAYAKTFYVLCKRFGIPVLYVESESHAYNYVQMENGVWYGMDTTWIDNDNSSNPYDMDMDWFLYGHNDALRNDQNNSHKTQYNKYGKNKLNGVVNISSERYVVASPAA